ncbi:Fur family transcriptional regulator [Helicobacter canadensis]|uniref:Transcriptional regulator, Fur family n=1 Tax=Helicobacter canadensis MIT 98-5491 TaxID=537970 RepID=C5ZYC3_9HELI|nr:Fur family transcriptional regulator [Helicobacter canadensis]EES90141.1 transcriptional regulator, Fur family [Helicobacter canadensis MIT 98-5491]EFR49295.1 transcriptional regulator, Fur family [Helicobacter canadensis MIT 98-5491]STP02354.1 peroxide stress regulator [Helicobacter canadensis]
MLEQLLKQNNLKITPQRITILKEIEKRGHISIEEIYENIREIHPSISLATIYKNLTSMQEAKIIDEVKLPNQKQRYELIKKPHIHLVCEKCGNITDMHFDNSIQQLKKDCETQTHYKIKDASIVLLGICEHCQNN